MSRYIDADALIDFIDVGHLRHPSELCFSEIDVVNLLLHAPTADVAPVVHGRWLTWEEQFPGEMPKKKSRLGVFCSACHNHSDNMFDYCPNCGCRMDGEDGEQR